MCHFLSTFYGGPKYGTGKEQNISLSSGIAMELFMSLKKKLWMRTGA